MLCIIPRMYSLASKQAQQHACSQKVNLTAGSSVCLRSYAEQYKRYSTESVASVHSVASSHATVSESKHRPFVWQMPFTLKCIGTFRYLLTVLHCFSLLCLFTRGHKATIWCQAAFGAHLYSGSSDGTVKVWDIADLRRGCLKTIPAHKEAVSGHSHSYLDRHWFIVTDDVFSCWQRDTVQHRDRPVIEIMAD